MAASVKSMSKLFGVLVLSRTTSAVADTMSVTAAADASAPVEEPMELPEALVADEEACSAEDGADGSCALELLQRRAASQVVATAASSFSAEEKAATTEEAETGLAPELVHEVFTFGAPATHNTPFHNKASPDGCFNGLRCYTEEIKGVHGEIKMVDAAAINNFYPHQTINTIVLRWQRDSIYAPCSGIQHKDGHPDWPQRGTTVFEEWTLHQENDYADRLRHLTLNGKDMSHTDPFATALNYTLFAWRTYDKLSVAKASIAHVMPNWRLVSLFIDVHGGDRDPVGLIQEENSLDCAVVFAGTNSFSELFTSTTNYGTGYCGFNHGVHVGYRNELWTLTGKYWQKYMKPRLSQCRKVTCIGHSLGGALCELFSACANSGHRGHPDFERLHWKKGTPKLMPKDFADVKR